MRLRVIVANIQSGIGVTKGYSQYVTSGWRYLLPHNSRGALDAGTWLSMEEADIALLTEVDGGSRRSRHNSQLDSIAETSGLSERRFFQTRLVGTSINEGSAILSRFPIIRHTCYPLASRVNPRVLGETTLVIENVEVTVLVAHLALGARPRDTQLKAIAAHIKDIEGPVLLGGDFNERDHEAFTLLTRAGLTPISVPGYPSWKPRHALQVLFTSHHFRVENPHVPDHARFSDHLPLIVDTYLQIGDVE